MSRWTTPAQGSTSTSKGRPSHRSSAPWSTSVRQPGTPGAPVDLPGGFGGLIEFGENLLALATDGVGSKLQIATLLEQWGGVGIDCMAMNVNDLLCVGAEPIAFVDYAAVPKPDPAIHAALGASLAEACRLAVSRLPEEKPLRCPASDRARPLRDGAGLVAQGTSDHGGAPHRR